MSAGEGDIQGGCYPPCTLLRVLGLKLLQELHQRLGALDGHGVVHGGAQTAHGLVTLQVVVTGVKALVASTLSIKPIMAGDKGNIVQRGQSIGMKKALRRMAEIILEEVGDAQHRTLMITHCNAPDRAETIKKLLTDKVQFRDCLIMDTRGVSSMYANDGGVIVTV